jgi:hypothetical protein
LNPLIKSFLAISKPPRAYLSTGQSLCSSEESFEEPIFPTSPGTKKRAKAKQFVKESQTQI